MASDYETWLIEGLAGDYYPHATWDEIKTIVRNYDPEEFVKDFPEFTIQEFLKKR